MSHPEPVMANCGHEVRRVPLRIAKVGKSLGSRRLPDVVWCEADGEVDGDEWTVAVAASAAFDGDGEMTPPDAEWTVIDTDEDSLSEAVRLVGQTLLDGDPGWEEAVFNDLERSWRRWAEERWTALGDRLPPGVASRLPTTVAFNGGGPTPADNGGESASSFSRDTENRRGEMFKLATLFVTYCCSVLKKLISERVQMEVFVFKVKPFAEGTDNRYLSGNIKNQSSAPESRR